MARELVEAVQEVCGERLIRIDEELITAAIELADSHRLTVYNAAYLACAQAYDWTLYSTDLRDLVGPGHALAP